MYLPKETLGDLSRRISHHFGVDQSQFKLWRPSFGFSSELKLKEHITQMREQTGKLLVQFPGE
jgi:hypothetical protein